MMKTEQIGDVATIGSSRLSE
ncbi:uncharacterized, partial [Tachysurus ichikawai]